MVPGENFTGAAPEATLIIIKVKPAKQYLRNFYLYPPDAEVFQENDVMMAIAYAISWAKKLEMPLSICLWIMWRIFPRYLCQQLPETKEIQETTVREFFLREGSRS